MGIKKDYIKRSTQALMRIHPEWDKEEVEKIVTQSMKQYLKDPSIYMDNNVTGANGKITLTELCNWIDKRNPVVSGNATFYKQPTELESPTSNMLRSLKKGRKAVKNKMFELNPESDEYQQLDLDQINKKVIMNAEYGGSGAPTAAFYTKYSPAATTLMAQSIITTMAAFFESYVGDNQKFFSTSECYDWMITILKKDEKVPKWVERPTAEETAERIINHFVSISPKDTELIYKFVGNCNSDELVYLYYANNMKIFISKHLKVRRLLECILTDLPLYEAAQDKVPDEFIDKFPPGEKPGKNLDDYNKWVSKEMFLNPYKIPDVISSYMEELINLMAQFVFVEYITPDSIVKLNNHLRNTVLLVDTDSNIINADLFVSYVLDELFQGESFGRNKMYNEMILVNVLAACLDKCVKAMLDFYGRCHHMCKDARAELTMKNEFMFRRLFLMQVKKRYAASIVLREGNINIPFKTEIKGMDFIKAGVTDDVTKRFTKMLQDHILFSEKLELHQLMQEIKNFEKEIYHDLKIGGTRYLKPSQYKSEDAYVKIKDENGKVIGTKAWSLPVFRGSAIWNELYPTKKINSLDRVKIIKLVVTGIQDLDVIKDKFPEEYNNIVNKIFMNGNPEIQKAGLKVICIPNSVNEVPKWIIPLIDYDVIISDVISSFRSVIDALNIQAMSFKTPNGSANITSCMISM